MIMLQPTQHALKDVLHRSGWQVLQHPPYSHDLSPCDCRAATRSVHLLTARLTVPPNCCGARCSRTPLGVFLLTYHAITLSDFIYKLL